MRLCYVLMILFFFACPTHSQVNLGQGLLAYYPLNGNANDLSGNNLNGSINNVAPSIDRNGVFGKAYYFNGRDAWIGVPYSKLYDFLPTSDFSIAAWVQPDSGSSWITQAIVVKSPMSTTIQSTWNYGLYLSNYKSMTGFHNTNFLLSQSTLDPDRCWYHLVFTYSNGKWNLYINGQPAASDNSQTKFILHLDSCVIALGRKGGSPADYYKGKMDEVRIYNRVITQDEITALSSDIIKPLVRANNDTTVCTGSPIQLQAKGADTYFWSPATGLSAANTSNPVAIPNGNIVYIVTGTAANGCSAFDTVSIFTNPLPQVSKANDTLVCAGTSFQLFASGGIAYNWTPGGTLSNPNTPNPIATPGANTTYFVKVTDNNQCSSTDSVRVKLKFSPIFSASPQQAICDGATVTLHAGGGDLYAWTPAIGISDPSIADPIASPATTTQYAVHITEALCHYDTTIPVVVTVNPNPQVIAGKSNDLNCGTLTAQLQAIGAISYTWSPTIGLDDPNTQNPMAGIDTTTTFTVKGTDANGCFSFDTVTVKVTATGKPIFMVPNAFSPNGDGKNDCLGIKKWGGVSLEEFSIFNRWGERVFTTNDPGHCWDGSFRGKQQETGAYTYIIRANSFCGKIQRRGVVVLVR